MSTTVKTACKCLSCGVTLNVGDKAVWHKKVIGHASVVRGGTFVRWKMECADHHACVARIHAAHLARQVVHATTEAQGCIDLLRQIATPEHHVNDMIAHYAKKGITVA